MGRICSAHWGNEKCIRTFHRKTIMEERDRLGNPSIECMTVSKRIIKKLGAGHGVGFFS
jgi:hypothetical protein